MDPLLRRCDRHYFLRCHVGIRSGLARRRDHGKSTYYYISSGGWCWLLWPSGTGILWRSICAKVKCEMVLTKPSWSVEQRTIRDVNKAVGESGNLYNRIIIAKFCVNFCVGWKVKNVQNNVEMLLVIVGTSFFCVEEQWYRQPRTRWQTNAACT